MNTQKKYYKTAVAVLSCLMLAGCGTDTMTQNEAKAYCKRTYTQSTVIQKYGETGLENKIYRFDAIDGAFSSLASLNNTTVPSNVATKNFFFNDDFFYYNLSPNFTYSAKDNILTASFKGTAKSFVKRILGDAYTEAAYPTVDGYVQATYLSTNEGLLDHIEWIYDISMTGADNAISSYKGTEMDYYFWTAVTTA